MILKVKNETSGFNIWDQLDNVEIHRARMESSFDPKDPHDAPPVETFFRQSHTQKKTNSPIYTPVGEPANVIAMNGEHKDDASQVYNGWIISADRPSGPFMIFFDTEGYLLNDKGQTIETYR